MTTRRISYAPFDGLTLDECHTHLRIDPVDSDGHPDDALIQLYLQAAVDVCENFTGLAFRDSIYETSLDCFPQSNNPIALPYQPNTVISFVIGEGSDSVPVDYNFNSITGLIYPQEYWPYQTIGQGFATITYIAGYDDASGGEAIPFAVKAAILIQLGHLYENREDTSEKPVKYIDSGVRSLLRPYRIAKGMA